MNFLIGALLASASLAGPARMAPEIQVEAPGPLAPLKGTLAGPQASGGPAMLIIPGSGPTDRDGNNPLGVRAATYRLLARGLAEQGIATVRIDKRGMFASAGAVTDGNAVTIADYAADVRSWTGSIRRRTGTPCVWLLGHSEGGLVALAASEAADVCGLILVSAPGRRLGEVLREQLKANPANAPLLDQALGAIDSLEAGRTVASEGMNPALLPLFAPQIQGFLISLFSYDPATMIAGVKKPVLILHGQRDIQVGEEDARRLKAGNPKASLVVLPDTNHALKAVTSGDRAANLEAYTNPDLPLAPGVVDAIATFVARNSVRR